MKRLNQISNSRIIKDKAYTLGISFITLLTITPIILIISKLIVKGIRQINLDFFIRTAPDTFEAMTAVNNGEVIPGGIVNGITGTLYMVILASLMAIPTGVAAGLFLFRNQGKIFSNLVRDLADIIQGIPSIVLGLIAYIWIVKNITNGYSALAGSTSLAIMMLPLIIRSTEETMKMIPENIIEAGMALGVPYYKIILRVLLPTGLSGLLTGILLAVSRVIGETAPLMLTALGSQVVNFKIDKPTSAVPLQIWEFYNDPNMVDLIWSSSLFLMGLVLVLNTLSKALSKNK